MPRTRAFAQLSLPGFEEVARLDDVRTLDRVEEVIVEYVACIDVLRPRRKARAPIDWADIAACRREIEQTLRALRLPVPDPIWLDGFIIELAAWWFEFEIAAD